MSDEFTDEELMAYADGELDPARRARLEALLPKRPDLAGRIDMFARARSAAAESVRTHLDEPVPAKLKASVEAMIRQASQPDSADAVVPLRPRKRTPFAAWAAPIAACLLALVAGAIGYWLATQGTVSSGDYQIAGIADPELDQVLSKLPSGEKSRLAGSGAEISMIASFLRGDQMLCREFGIAHAAMGDHLAIACRSAGKWSIDLALRTAGGAANAYKPASSAETIDAFLHALGAGPALEGQAETDALAKLH
ncbi:anti-sigma factor family protein [Taklimakanibacter deserti]|uniref:anti-sigma factor family protein n=1 Tax=Taklimakanibacter deserti TaxID=2267839 RepID=UPI000E649A56